LGGLLDGLFEISDLLAQFLGSGFFLWLDDIVRERGLGGRLVGRYAEDGIVWLALLFPGWGSENLEDEEGVDLDVDAISALHVEGGGKGLGGPLFCQLLLHFDQLVQFLWMDQLVEGHLFQSRYAVSQELAHIP